MEIDRNSPATTIAARNGINRYNFLGKETQVATGYIDLQAQFYDPVIGRFFSIDPETEGQLEFSPYHYSFDNPIRFSDPDGRFPTIIAIPYILEGLAILSEAAVVATVATVIKEGIVRAGPGAGGAYSPATGMAMSLSKPGEITGGYRNANGQKEDKKTSNSTNDLSKAEERAAKLSQKDRPGQDMTKAGKGAVIDVNKAKNNGKTVCTDCGVETVPAKQSKKGVTPPKNETNVDHVNPKSKGGSGTPNNGDVRCGECNIKKSNN